jgi:hypothetical protein
MAERLLNWESLPLTISGAKATEVVGKIIETQQIPIKSLFLEFREGELLIEGKAKKGMTIPFEVTIREILCEGSVLHIRIHDVSAFGLPVPAFLGKFLEGIGRDDSIRFDGSTNTISVDVGKKAPPFVDVTFSDVRFVKGGLEITLGPGGSDLPPPHARSEKA